MFENIGPGHGMGWNPTNAAAAEADASGEQQLKRAQSGSSSLEAEANGKQQLKRMPQSGPGAAAEATQAASSS